MRIECVCSYIHRTNNRQKYNRTFTFCHFVVIFFSISAKGARNEWEKVKENKKIKFHFIDRIFHGIHSLSLMNKTLSFIFFCFSFSNQCVAVVFNECLYTQQSCHQFLWALIRSQFLFLYIYLLCTNAPIFVDFIGVSLKFFFIFSLYWKTCMTSAAWSENSDFDF